MVPPHFGAVFLLTQGQMWASVRGSLDRGENMSGQGYPEEKGERTYRPAVGDVIICEAFANGWSNLHDPIDSDLIWVADQEPANVGSGSRRKARSDVTRNVARFVVEESHVSGQTISWKEYRKGGGYGDPFEWEEDRHEHGWYIQARRLRSDGTYDPDAEAIQFLTFQEREALRRCRGNQGQYIRDSLIIDTPILRVRKMELARSFV